MASTGRNDPCPCGSGKKYKRCCLSLPKFTELRAEGQFTQADRASALRKLLEFARRSEFDQDLEIASRLFWGGRLEGRADEEIQRLEHLPQVDVMFNSWMLFDLEIEDRQTLTDMFLATEGRRLSPGERAYLERAKATFISLYEAEEVRRDKGLVLRDLWSSIQIQVGERLATQSIARWDLLAARLMQMPNGDWVMEAGGFQYPPILKEALLKRMRTKYSSFQRRLPGRDGTDILKRVGLFFGHWWLDDVVFVPLPKITTAEGDEFVLAKAVFDTPDRERALRSLSNCSEFEQAGPNSFRWLEDAGTFRRTLGTIRVEKTRLVLETTSRARAERGRKLLEGVTGDAMRYRATAYEDLAHALKDLEYHPHKEQNKSLPPELEADALRNFYDQHYQKWPDQPLPALSGRTPRQAARLKSQRPKLITLLKDMVNREAHATKEGRLAYDFSWLWEKLGLNQERDT